MKHGAVLLLGLCLLFLASQQASGGAIQNINWDPQVESYILDVTFGAVEGNATDPQNTHNINLGGPWRVNVTVLETPATLLGFGQDSVTIIGSTQHLVAPHVGDAANGFPQPIDFTFLAPLTIPATGLITPSTGPMIRDHPAIGHFDEFSLDIIAHVSQGLVFRDIDSWELIMRGEHVVPEPSTLFLLGSSLAALGAATWRRHRRK
jgi:hypothetical protein